MALARKTPGLRAKIGLWFALATLIPILPPPHATARAETAAPAESERLPVRELSGHFPDKPSVAPSWSFPVEPFGFSAPGQNYLGMRTPMVSLDFLGEDRLLFTFRVPGLMRREPGNTAEDQRQIRAVVLAVPSGALQAEANWTVHDRLRYLSPLDDDHFLLRDRNSVLEGDATLALKPLLQFPGPLVSVQLSPGRQYIITNSHEPPQTATAGNSADPKSGAASGEADGQPELVLRILHRDSHQVMLVTHVTNPVDLPMNSDGFLSAQRGTGVQWDVLLNYFTGPNRTITTIKSNCAPYFDFLSESEALVTACSDSGDNALIAITTAGKTLWTDLATDRQVWPLMAMSRSGLRFARESLYVSHSVNAFDPLGTGDIKGQWVRVFDTSSGNVAFESPATPILDAGGNVAISPSGRRVAILNAGAIQVFELPAPPALPAAAVTRTAP